MFEGAAGAMVKARGGARDVWELELYAWRLFETGSDPESVVGTL
jgi:hypothetical protein